MSELTDWVWLFVAVVWVAARVLPRLFRKQAGRTTAAPAKQPTIAPPLAGWPPSAADAAPARVGPPQLDPQARKRISSAEPIEPR